MSYREHKIIRQAEALKEGVYEGEMGPVSMFAEHLAVNGELGLGMTLHAGTTVADIVEHYVSSKGGQLILAAWAQDEARDQQQEAEMEGAA